MIQSLEIKNFKSIRDQKIELRNLNVLIGQNGAGKSNLISLFTFFERLYQKQLADYIFSSGGINNFVFGGARGQKSIGAKINFVQNGLGYSNYYEFELLSDGERYVFKKDTVGYSNSARNKSNFWDDGHLRNTESSLQHTDSNIGGYVRNYFTSFRVYHFHDTSQNSPIKQLQDIIDIYFAKDGSTIAPYLDWLKNIYPINYRAIVESVKLIYPIFHDFYLEESLYAKGKISLCWMEKGGENIFKVSQMSDGTLRFICLAALLNMPKEIAFPQTIIIDEPELGLHPKAIEILAALIKKASVDRQIIIATQSAALVDNFTPEDIIVADRLATGETVFNRKTTSELSVWLDDYSLGELWLSNIIGGRP